MVRADSVRRTAEQRLAEQQLAEQRLADQKLFERAVEAIGSYSELARRLDVSLSTLHGWKRRGSTPSWRAKEIRALVKAEKLGPIVEPGRQPRKKERGRARVKRAH